MTRWGGPTAAPFLPKKQASGRLPLGKGPNPW
jgi:hypothetical protein